MKYLPFVVFFLTMPFALASHTDIPYYAYDAETRPVYDHGTDVRGNAYVSRLQSPVIYTPQPIALSRPAYSRDYLAAYQQGNLYERFGYTTEHEIRRNENDAYYGLSHANDKYKETETYERKIEYQYDRTGYFYSRYEPRYDGRARRTFSGDYSEGIYASGLYGSGRIAIENLYGPVHYNYRGQRYGYDNQGRRFYY